MTHYTKYGCAIQTFFDRMPTFPLCTNAFSGGVEHKPRDVALKREYVQTNPRHYQQALVFDVDHKAAVFAAEDANVLQPSFITKSNNGNGHAHLVYVLKEPVGTHDHANFAPVRFAAAIQRAFTRRLGADRGYAGLITKNPLTHETIDFNRMFSLGEMDAWLDFGDKAPDYKKQESQGLGRNVDMFDMVRFEAYREVSSFACFSDFSDFVSQRCSTVNASFESPLPACEPRATSKSVASWTWQNRHSVGGNYKNKGVMMLDMCADMDLQAKQRAGAEYAAKVKREGTLSKIQNTFTLLASIGKKPTQKAIVESTGISLKTVKRHWKNIQK